MYTWLLSDFEKEEGGGGNIEQLQFYHLNSVTVNSWTVSSLHDNMHEGKHWKHNVCNIF